MQNARKKLENRRLAYDTSLAKMQKAKKEDYRAEEDLRTQKVKYEESTEDVYRRMEDIRESEAESVNDLRAFVDAELEYYDRCREVLLQLRDDWPVGYVHIFKAITFFFFFHPAQKKLTVQNLVWFSQSQNTNAARRGGRSRSNTAHSYHERYAPVVEEPPPPMPTQEPRQTLRSSRTTPTYLAESPPHSRSRDYSPDAGVGGSRPSYSRTPTFEGPSQMRRDHSPVPSQRISRVPSDSNVMRNTRAQLRTVSGPAAASAADPYGNHSNNINNNNNYAADENYYNGFYTTGGGGSGNSPDGYLAPEFPVSSTASPNGSGTSTPSVTGTSPNSKKGPPPPPPSRAKKPPPPPPPVKRNLAAGGM